MNPDEAIVEVTESFLINMTVEHRDPWEFYDWSHNTWGFQQVQALQLRMGEILQQENPSPDRTAHAVRITKAVFTTTGVPFNESRVRPRRSRCRGLPQRITCNRLGLHPPFGDLSRFVYDASRRRVEHLIAFASLTNSARRVRHFIPKGEGIRPPFGRTGRPAGSRRGGGLQAL